MSTLISSPVFNENTCVNDSRDLSYISFLSHRARFDPGNAGSTASSKFRSKPQAVCAPPRDEFVQDLASRQKTSSLPNHLQHKLGHVEETGVTHGAVFIVYMSRFIWQSIYQMYFFFRLQDVWGPHCGQTLAQPELLRNASQHI
jgi:hypothetical protein